MFIPFIPIVPETTVINKTIVYQDTVLNLKELGSNIKITSISDIKESSFEECLKTILKNNVNVTFNTIQYSKSEKKIYFYTDKEIKTNAWNNIDIVKYDHIKNNQNIISVLIDIMDHTEACPEDSVNLFEVCELSATTHKKVEKITESYRQKAVTNIHQRYENGTMVVHYFTDNMLHIGIRFHDFKHTEYSHFNLAKENGDLYIYESKNSVGHDLIDKDIVLSLIGQEMSELFDILKEHENEKEASGATINKNGFVLKIYRDSVAISAYDKKKSAQPYFSLIKYHSHDEYKYESNSNNLSSFLKGNEADLFKKMYVEIEACPAWMRQPLKEAKQTTLVKPKEKSFIKKIMAYIKK